MTSRGAMPRFGVETRPLTPDGFGGFPGASRPTLLVRRNHPGRVRGNGKRPARSLETMHGPCPRCGGANLPGTAQCQWCGSTLPLPLLETRPPEQGYRPLTTDVEPSESQSGIHPGLIVAAIVVVLIIVSAIAYVSLGSTLQPAGPSVNITGLSVTSPDNACGLNGDDHGTIQLHPPGRGIPFITWGIPGPGGSVPCTVENVSTSTLGFTLFGEFPVTANTSLSVMVVSMIPPASFSGILEVTFH